MSKESCAWHRSKTQQPRSCLNQLYLNSCQLISSIQTPSRCSLHRGISRCINPGFSYNRAYSEQVFPKSLSQPSTQSLKNRRILAFQTDHQLTQDLSLKAAHKNIIIQACLIRNNKKKIKIFNFKDRNTEQRSELQAYPKLILSRTPQVQKFDDQIPIQSMFQAKKLRQLCRRKDSIFEKVSRRNREKQISGWELDNFVVSDQF